MTVRCLIVDDSDAFVAAARSLLEQQGITVVGAVGTGADAVRLAAELRPDVVLVDIDLGPESGLELTRRLAGAAYPVPVILMSTYAKEDYADLVGDSSALGFIPKTALSAAAIRALLDGSDTDVPPRRLTEPPKR